MIAAGSLCCPTHFYRRESFSSLVDRWPCACCPELYGWGSGRSGFIGQRKSCGKADAAGVPGRLHPRSHPTGPTRPVPPCVQGDRRRTDRPAVSLSFGGAVYDPTDPVGRLLVNVLAMVAEFAADLIRLQTREDIKIAKAKARPRPGPVADVLHRDRLAIGVRNDGCQIDDCVR